MSSRAAIWLSLLMLAGRANAATPRPEGAVWQWYAHCSAPRQIKLEVILDRRKIYSTEFGVCHLPRSIELERPQRILRFKLVSHDRSLFGERKGEALEGNVWEASEGEDDLILGVSFAGPRRIWCNTIHALDPQKASGAFLARGLIVRTRPER